MQRKPTRATGVLRDCLHCEEPFYASKYNVERGNGKFCSRHCARSSRQGPEAARWAGGRCIDPDGYVRIKLPGHPNANKRGYILEHRLVMARHLGRPLTSHELVHHKNEVRTDNRISNLQLVTRGEHMQLHHALDRWSLKHKCCVSCGTIDKKHAARGMCDCCYTRYKRAKRKTV